MMSRIDIHRWFAMLAILSMVSGGHFENKNDPECNFHHYQSIPHFKITLDINFH
jgi:hypothetical protein